MNLLTTLNEAGTTIVMVTHSTAFAEYCHRVIHLFDGHIVTQNRNRRSPFAVPVSLQAQGE